MNINVQPVEHESGNDDLILPAQKSLSPVCRIQFDEPMLTKEPILDTLQGQQVGWQSIPWASSTWVDLGPAGVPQDNAINVAQSTKSNWSEENSDDLMGSLDMLVSLVSYLATSIDKAKMAVTKTSEEDNCADGWANASK